jgi:2-oxoglutarate/2-oxoacid ferredoxin oxidoreductase subunit alpha
MSPSELAVQEAAVPSATVRVVNDFSIQVATVNGSGSQTANLVLLRSIFQSGVPVSGKNMFPSPTRTATSPGRRKQISWLR